MKQLAQLSQCSRILVLLCPRAVKYRWPLLPFLGFCEFFPSAALRAPVCKAVSMHSKSVPAINTLPRSLVFCSHGQSVKAIWHAGWKCWLSSLIMVAIGITSACVCPWERDFVWHLLCAVTDSFLQLQTEEN